MDRSWIAPEGAAVVLACCSLSVVRCLASTGIRTTLADCDPDSIALQSRHARDVRMIACPRTQPEQAVEDLIAISQRYARTGSPRPMLVFDNEPMLLLASRHRERLLPHYRFLVPDKELAEDLTCKLRFAELADRLGLPAPRSLVVTGDTTVADIAKRIGFPCILKPNSHVGGFSNAVERDHGFGYKILIAHTIEELQREYTLMRTYCRSFVAQQYIAGDDRCLYSFHVYLDRDSGPLGYFVGRKIRTYPRGSGGSTYLELVYEPEVVRIAMQAIRRMRATGAMKIDLKYDPFRKRWFILECNARFTIWNYLGAICGANLPLTAMADLYDQPIPPPQRYLTNRRWLSLGDDLRAFVREYRPAGEWTWPQYLRSLCARKVYDVFAWSDPMPLLVTAGRYLSANAKKLRRRLAGNRLPAPVALPVPAAASVAASAPAPVPERTAV